MPSSLPHPPVPLPPSNKIAKEVKWSVVPQYFPLLSEEIHSSSQTHSLFSSRYPKQAL